MRYAVARYKRDELETAYRVYISDSIYWAVRRSGLRDRYAETLERRKKQDNRSGNEIALDVIKRAGLTIKGEEGE